LAATETQSIGILGSAKNSGKKQEGFEPKARQIHADNTWPSKDTR